MKYLIVSVITIVFCLLTIDNLMAQDKCRYKELENKLQVTEMVFNTARDTIHITVQNDCDTCDQYVYTGIIVYRGEFIDLYAVEDTLAIDKRYGSNFTPENNSERTYTAIVKKDFDLSQNFKVGLLGICESIPLSSDISLSIKEKKTEGLNKVYLQNNKILLTGSGQTIKEVSVYNLSGQLVRKKNGIFNSVYELKLVKPGIYLVSVTLSNDETINLKYFEPK